MHAVRSELLHMQASAAGLPLYEIPIPSPCTNADYESIMGAFVANLLREGMPPQPYNLDTLVIWTLLFGLLGQERHGRAEEQTNIAELLQMLSDDLSAEDRWLVPLKGRLTS